MRTAVQRVPWPPNFPDVVVHLDLRARNNHPAYAAAKSGDANAAYALVSDVLAANNFSQIVALIGERKPLIAPVAAVEADGFNAIPDAMAQAIARALALTMADYDIRQSNFVGHTGADGWFRLATQQPSQEALNKGKIICWLMITSGLAVR